MGISGKLYVLVAYGLEMVVIGSFRRSDYNYHPNKISTSLRKGFVDYCCDLGLGLKFGINTW